MLLSIIVLLLYEIWIYWSTAVKNARLAATNLVIHGPGLRIYVLDRTTLDLLPGAESLYQHGSSIAKWWFLVNQRF